MEVASKSTQPPDVKKQQEGGNGTPTAPEIGTILRRKMAKRTAIKWNWEKIHLQLPQRLEQQRQINRRNHRSQTLHLMVVRQRDQL